MFMQLQQSEWEGGRGGWREGKGGGVGRRKLRKNKWQLQFLEEDFSA